MWRARRPEDWSQVRASFGPSCCGTSRQLAPFPPAPFPRIGGKGGLVLKRDDKVATFGRVGRITLDVKSLAECDGWIERGDRAGEHLGLDEAKDRETVE